MHLLELHYANARLNQTGKFIFPCRNGTIPKWTILSSRPREREKLQLMALAMAGTRCFPRISYQKNRLLNFPQRPLQLKFYLAQHPETEGANMKYDFVGHGLQLYDDGRIQKITKQECRYLSPIMGIWKIRDHSNLAKHFMLVYGPDIKAQKKHKSGRIGPGTILLVDVDGRLPNLALMKLSRYHKGQGRKVSLRYKDCCIKGPEAVYASAVFHNHTTDQRISKLRRYYGESLMLGGSGVYIHRRLPANIENISPDYDLYPKLGDRAIGFLTRGCPFRCAFCIVPAKEGQPHQVSDLDSL